MDFLSETFSFLCTVVLNALVLVTMVYSYVIAFHFVRLFYFVASRHINHVTLLIYFYFISINRINLINFLLLDP